MASKKQNGRKQAPTEKSAPPRQAGQELLVDGKRAEAHNGFFPIAGLGASAGGLEALGEMDELGRALTVQIFATDLDAAAIDVARIGVRKLIVFAPQNLIRDPAPGVSDRQQVALQIDGRRRTYDLCVGPKRDEHGKVAGPPCVAVDITFPP